MPEMIQNKNIDIEYVYIEMVLNQENECEVIPGLFQGIKVKEGSTFILLHGKKDVTNIVNLKFYNVMTIEVLYKEHKDMTHLTTSIEDQKIALDMLDKIYRKFLENKSAPKKDGDLINIADYINVPDKYYEGAITKLKDRKDKSTHIQHNGVGNFANTNNSFQTQNKEKELVPSIFNRNGSKKPSKSSLDIMQTKIDQINLNKFEQKLPETAKDVDEINDQNVINLYDESHPYW